MDNSGRRDPLDGEDEALSRDGYRRGCTCSNSVGIFLRALAEEALQALTAGADPSHVLPFWRVLDARSPLASRLSCEAEFIRIMRASEVGNVPQALERKGSPPAARALGLGLNFHDAPRLTAS